MSYLAAAIDTLLWRARMVHSLYADRLLFFTREVAKPTGEAPPSPDTASKRQLRTCCFFGRVDMERHPSLLHTLPPPLPNVTSLRIPYGPHRSTESGQFGHVRYNSRW